MWRTGGFIGNRVVPTIDGAVGLWQFGELESAKRVKIWPTTPYISDALWANVVLLLHLDGSAGATSFPDTSSSAHSVTAMDGAAISTTQSKWGGASLYCDGNLDGLQLPSSTSLNFGTGPYTIEWWQRSNGTQQSFSAVFSRYSTAPTAGGSVNLEIYNCFNGTNGIYFVPATGASTLTASVNVNDNAWHHIACVRSGTTASVYIDGTRSATTSSLSATATATMSSGRIGRSQTNNLNNNNYTGWMDDIRITTAARYSGASITAPTWVFPDN